ncbi:MAG: DNA polymerase Y family protein [Gammaproteobacteria bacterium]
MSLRSLFIDFDAYFASVEQQLRPELRGRPVAVVPVMADTTCCIAASYEAKRFGVKTGTRVAEARRLCPALELVHARHEHYVEYHHRLVAAVESCIPVEAVASIDEMACTLTGSWCAPARALEVARDIKRAVREVGEALGCSIGIAPNRFIAKLASKIDKPDGLKIIRGEDLPAALYELELAAVTGVGRRMLVRLEGAGIDSVEALCAASEAELRRIWGGIGGARMYAALRGAQQTAAASERASIGHSHVLPPDMRSDAEALAVLHRLLQKAAWRLRTSACAAGGLALTLRYTDGSHRHGERRFAPSQDTLVFGQALKELWTERETMRAPLLGVGVTLVRLTRATQGSLFEETHRHERLNVAVDRLNERFGAHAVYFGGAHRALDAAPMRIAFTHIPDPDLER